MNKWFDDIKTPLKPKNDKVKKPKGFQGYFTYRKMYDGIQFGVQKKTDFIVLCELTKEQINDLNYFTKEKLGIT